MLITISNKGGLLLRKGRHIGREGKGRKGRGREEGKRRAREGTPYIILHPRVPLF